MTTMWHEEIGTLDFPTVDLQVRSWKKYIFFSTMLLKIWVPSLYFSSACYQFIFQFNIPCSQAKATEPANLSITLPVEPQFFHRFAKVSAAWVTADIRLLCHAPSQQGVMILFKAVETTKVAPLLNLKIKEECRWCVCRWDVESTEKTRLSFWGCFLVHSPH